MCPSARSSGPASSSSPSSFSSGTSLSLSSLSLLLELRWGKAKWSWRFRLFPQTISIRKFLRELEQDAILLDRQLQASYGKQVANSQVIPITKANHIGGQHVLSLTFQDNLKNYVWTDDDHIADVFDETKTPPTGENGNQQPRRASGSSSNFNVRTNQGACLQSWCYLYRTSNFAWGSSRSMTGLKFCPRETRRPSSECRPPSLCYDFSSGMRVMSIVLVVL